MLCRALEVHPSGYYDWLIRPISNQGKKDQKLTKHIKLFWLERGYHAGYRNIHQDLMEARISCRRDRTLRLMRAARIRAERGYKAPKGYYGGACNPAAPHVLQRQFEVEKPNQWWVSDITYIHIHEGFLFLAVVMVLYARNIIGWSMAARITDDLVLGALTMAYWRRKPEGRVMLHSDQGSQYTIGNCHDNAVAESFFANLKKEKVCRKKHRTRAEACTEIFEYIEMFYSPKRRHTHYDRVSPTDSEQAYFKQLESV
jgi:putative transposase